MRKDEMHPLPTQGVQFESGRVGLGEVELKVKLEDVSKSQEAVRVG